ncbi:unnamed protein product, partial [Rotaria sp. Silwood2]
MSTFICSLCHTQWEFKTFSKFFRHITIYHQNDAGFRMTCDLNETCGVAYRTYSAYKADVYRRHSSELYTSEKNICNTTLISTNDNPEDTNSSFDSSLIYDDGDDTFNYFDNDNTIDLSKFDSENDSEANTLSSITSQDHKLVTMLDVKRLYTSFILQLREEFYLPKNTIDTISSYLVTLINHLEYLFEAQSFNSNCNRCSSTTSKEKLSQIVELKTLKDIMKNVCNEIQNITKNEYQFIKGCEQFFDYTPPQEIIVSEKNEELEQGYFIPIQKTLSLMLCSQPMLAEILQNVQAQRLATDMDDDLMFSYRDGAYGSRIDDGSLLLQLYIDDIGVTNPIGVKKDQHKLSMIYFSLEDVPDQYRSRLDFIHLLGVCK